MVRSTFVAEHLGRGQGCMVDEPVGVVENRLQYAHRRGCFDGPVEVASEVCGREVHLAIRGVGARTHRRGIGGPHARSRATRGEELEVVQSRAAEHVFIPPGKPELAQHVDGRPIVRWQHPLGHTEIVKELHLAQPLLGRRFGIRHGVDVALRREVAQRKPAVVVRRADQAVEVDLPRLQSVIPGGSVSGRASASCSRDATGCAQ